MGGTVFWNADWFPELLLGGVVFVVGALLLGRLAQQVKRRAVRAASEESPVVQPVVPNHAALGRAAAKPATEPLPALIGGYRIEKKLGKGAMGEVFLGRDTGTGQLAAIKTLALAQAFAPDELAEVRARFFREAETAGRMRHPGIVAILDSGEDGDLAFIAMEYLVGTDLRPFTRPGHLLPLSQVASVAVADARSLTITPWEKQIVGAVEKAILGSDLGLTPNTAGTVIRLNLPALTEERRKELSKVVHGEGEDTKVAIRNIRRDANHHVKELLKDKQITEDEMTRSEADVQKMTDKAIKDVDDVVKAKEQELMAV